MRINDEMRKCIFVFALLMILFPNGVLSGPTDQPIGNQEYDNNVFDVSQKEFRHGEVLIKIFQAKKKKSKEVAPHECRAWITIERSGKLQKRIYYDDISPVGDRYGIFLPKKQPYKEFFIIIKLGDYDGRLIVVDIKGNVVDEIGGRFFTARDKRYLFSEYDSDIGGISVLDMKTGQVVFTSTETPYVDGWYHYKGSVAFTKYNPLDKKKKSAETLKKGRTIHIFDFKDSKFNQAKMHLTSSDLKKIEYHFNDPKGCDCGSCK
jgi:hypothetical protein